MNVYLARHLIRTAFQNSRNLQELLPLLKAHCDLDEYNAYARDIAAAVDATNVALTNRVVATFPELQQEIEVSLAKYDRYI